MPFKKTANDFEWLLHCSVLLKAFVTSFGRSQLPDFCKCFSPIPIFFFYFVQTARVAGLLPCEGLIAPLAYWSLGSCYWWNCCLQVSI